MLQVVQAAAQHGGACDEHHRERRPAPRAGLTRRYRAVRPGRAPVPVGLGGIRPFASHAGAGPEN